MSRNMIKKDKNITVHNNGKLILLDSGFAKLNGYKDGQNFTNEQTPLLLGRHASHMMGKLNLLIDAKKNTN